MRVLCIDHEGGHGGSSRSLIQLLSALQQQNSINCEVWFRRKGPIEKIYRDLKIRCKHVPEIPTFTTVHQCTRNLLSLFRCVFGIMASFPTLIRMARQIEKEFDLVHFNHPNLWVLALLLKTIVKCPFTFHIRVSLKNLSEIPNEPWIYRVSNKVSSFVFAFLQVNIIFLISQRLFFVSTWDHQEFIRMCPRAKGAVVFNCIDIDQHSGLLAKGKACGRIKRLVSVENYRWSRGTDRLISLAKYFKSVRITEIRFDIVGDMSISKHVANFYVPKNEGSLLKLSDICAYYGVQNYFMFHGHLRIQSE